MQVTNTPVFKEILLAGGGHTHVLLIRQWAMNPLPGVRLTLVSPDSDTPYSGMLPGLVARHYAYDDLHIDLVRLCQQAGVRFIQDEVTGINSAEQQVTLVTHPPLSYDLLSINSGCTPNLSIPGAADFTIPVKPISRFWQRWQQVLTEMHSSDTPQSIAVVGGGAGSVEIILAMAWSCANDPDLSTQPHFHLVYQAPDLLAGYPGSIRTTVKNACRKLGIQLHPDFRVSACENGKIYDNEGSALSTSHIFWCTQAAAADWPLQSGLACDEDGFIKVKSSLQSLNHPNIFAVGDIASMVNTPRPKAGVYAVRQAPVLFENLRNLLLKRPLIAYQPQTTFLSLLALGEKTATGSWGFLTIKGKWVWHWKNRIDRKFIARFRHIPEMPEKPGNIPEQLVPQEEVMEQLDPAQRCAGCGAKVGPGILASVLREFNPDWQAEDASILPWPASTLVQSTDALTAPFDNPWLFGRVAVFHALNDLLARNAIPHSIQIAVTLPFAGRKIQQRELKRLLQGIHSACEESEVILLGGHTSEGSALTITVTANGSEQEPVYGKHGLVKGAILATNKALGTGTMFAAHMQGLAKGKNFENTLKVINTSNQQANTALHGLNVLACTDISGFGLLGHLVEMIGDTAVTPILHLHKLPIQTGVEQLVEAGIQSTLIHQNAAFLANTPWLEEYRQDWRWSVLLDPQTSGGLLVAARQDSGQALEKAGFTIIGELI